MNRFLRRLFCWFFGHGDLRIRLVNAKTRTTVYTCGDCGAVWAERDGVQA